MKVLVTGANGFVGRAASVALYRSGFDVRAASRLMQLGTLDFEQVIVDSINADAHWQNAFSFVNVVVHCAARVHVIRDVESEPLSAFRTVNLHGTLNLARQAAAARVRRFVFISSIKVNGVFTVTGCPFTETHVPCPQDAYAISKFEAEQGLNEIAAQTGMEVVIIRPPLVYGPGVKANFAALMRAVQRGYPLPLGAIHNQRSLIGLDNLVDFIITCVTHPKAANQTFLISDGQDLSTTELVRAMAQATGVPARLLPVPVWALQLAGRLTGKSDAIQRLCGNLQIDSGKALTLLGWKPKLSVTEGLRQLVEK